MKHFSFFPDLPPKKRRLLLIPALILILAAGIFLYRTLPPSSDPDSFFSRSLTSKSENEQFTAFTETLFRQEVSSDTISLHYSLQNPEAYGILDAPVTLGSFPSNPDSAAASMENMLAALRRFSFDHLSEKNQLTYLALESYLKTNLECAPYLLYEEPLSPITGIQAQLPVLLSEFSFQTTTDIDTYLALLSTMQEYFTSLSEFEQAKSGAGLFMSDACADQVIKECRDFVSLGDAHYLYTSFEERLDAMDQLTDSERALYTSKNRDLIETQVFPAYKSLASTLEKYKGTGSTQKGLCSLPEGKSCYEAILKRETGSDRSVNELAKLASSQIIQDMKELKQALPASGTAGEVILKDSSAESILLDLKQQMSASFPDIPDIPFSVKEVPISMQDYLSPAFYLTPPIDNEKQNTIYINPKSTMEGLPLFTTLAHEGYPGHMYQTTYFLSQDPPPLRSILDFGGYVEGWATYTEMISYYYAPIAKDTAVIQQKNASIILGLYALADIGIHYKGWSLEETDAFFSDYGITDQNAISEIYQLILSDPANYPKYYFGYLEFLELKKEALHLWGNEFTQKRFHKQVLDAGPVPFSILREYVLHGNP